VTGERLMASTADGELARADIRRAALVAAGVDALFVADPETRAILRVERR